MLMECQQVETCYIGREQYKNALNRTMDLTANPSLGSAGLMVLTRNLLPISWNLSSIFSW